MDDLFSRIERPSRYLGNEINSVRKDLSSVRLKVALAYPDLYEIGMSNTGLHILYYMLNEAPEVAAERVYLPARDLEALLKAEGRPLTTLENRVPLRELDVLGIQLPHELSYANIVKMIRLGQIPLWSEERGDDDPYVLGGGPGAFAPEVVAPFYDAILLGDAEEALWQVLAVVREAREARTPRRDVLRRLAGLTGVYVPSLYAVDYHDDGTIAAVRPLDPAAPTRVHKAVIDDLEGAFYPERAIVPYAETVHDRLGVEVMRGCTVGCRFCQAGMIYRPLRERSPKRILDLATCGLGATGYGDVSLLSLDTGDYTLIEPLTKELLETTEERRVSLSLPSLRAGSLTDDVIRDIRRVRRTSFTVAPEAGTQRLRDVINKNISDEEIFETVERVAQNGWTALKLYFMVGFPTETEEDLDGLVDLVTRCRDLGRRYARKFNVTASIGTLVPKPQTPFQWDPQLDRPESIRRMTYVAHRLRERGIGCKYHDADRSWLEGVFTRADRRLAPVVADAEARGAGFESWEDLLDIELWRRVFADHGIDPERLLRRRAYDEVLPWDHLSPRVTKKYLLNDRKKVDRLASPTTFDCRDDLCAGCAVCFEGDTRNRLAKYHADPFGDGRRLPMAYTSRIAMGHGVARQLAEKVRDQAAKAGADAIAAKLRRRRPKQPGERRWAVTPGAPGGAGPADAFSPEAIAAENAAQQAAAAAAAATPSPPPVAPEPSAGGRPLHWPEPGVAVRTFAYRLQYRRLGDLRWLSHRELLRTFYRLFTRSELPLHYTQGFHPKPKVSFGPPLPVGVESLAEEVDLLLVRELEPEAVLTEMQRLMPAEQGLVAAAVERCDGRRSIQAERRGARWEASLATLELSPEAARAGLAEFEAQAEAWVEAERGKRASRRFDLRRLIERATVAGDALAFDLGSEEDGGTVKPFLAAAALTGLSEARVRAGRLRLVAALRRERPAALPVA